MNTSIGISYLRQMLEGVCNSGFEKEYFLEKAGIPTTDYYRNDVRIDARQVSLLCRAIWRETKDEFMMFFDEPCQLGVSRLALRHISRCSTLGEALRDYVNFYQLIRTSEFFSLSVNEADVKVIFNCQAKENLDADAFIAFTLLTVHRLCCWMTGQRIRLKGTGFKTSESEFTKENEIMFPGGISYNESENYISFSRKDFELPIVRLPDEFDHWVNRSPIDVLSIPGDDFSYSSKIKSYILKHEGEVLTFPDIDTIASSFYVSKQSLHRYLTNEGTSYQKLKDDIRRTSAVKKLQNTELTIAEISHRLNFSEPGSFARAFKQWTGVSPSEFRKNNVQFFKP